MNKHLNDKREKKKKDDIILKNRNKFKLCFKKIILINRIKKVLIKKEKNSPKVVNQNIINKIIKNIPKYEKNNIFNTIYKTNRTIIDLFSQYYEDIIINKKVDNIDLIYVLHDKNKNRFLRLIELFYIIKKDDILYNSNIIFNYYTLAKVHKKNNNFEIFIDLLKNKIV